jgi:hypothetical protein
VLDNNKVMSYVNAHVSLESIRFYIYIKSFVMLSYWYSMKLALLLISLFCISDINMLGEC